ncbi:MAG: iron ABC transporter permease [Ruminococcus sp.]|nr:iron ABC transporter permease [Ruminococcus sp.]
MDKKRAVRYTLGFVMLAALAVIFFMLNILIGSSSMTVTQAFAAITGHSDTVSAARIITDIRLPRTAAAFLLGGALSVSGFLLQCFFNNPIAGPYILGISSGAKLTVALTMIVLLRGGMTIAAGEMVAAAFVGSLISMGMILLISGKVRNMAQLVISGVMIGYICSAVTDLVVAFADDADIVNLHNWSKGSFSGTSRADIPVIAAIVVCGTAAAFLLSKPLSAYQLGERYAMNLGVNIGRFRLALILLSSLLSACVTAFAGPVSFVGVAVPHLMKGLFGTARPLVLIPASFLGGAAVCMVCDLAARMLFAPVELSISTVTAVFGAPVVIMIMLSREKERRGA